MRVFIKNVIETAIEQGVNHGYRQIDPNGARDHRKKAVDTIMKSIRKSLDKFVDLSDDDDEEPKESEGNGKSKIGFQQTEAVVESESLEEDDELNMN